MSLSESRVDEAAQTLAIESRSLLGLPIGVSSGKPWIQHLASPPSPLEFSRIIARHTPLLIDKCIEDRSCSLKWKQSTYLEERMGNKKVQVTLTPNGRADDIHLTEGDGKEVFVLPHTVQMCVSYLLIAFLC
jgi:jumonji domain-containing protein 7